MKLVTVVSFVSFVLLFAKISTAQIAPPGPGVDMPQAYYDRLASDPGAFQFQHAWIDKARRARERREALRAQGPTAGLQMSAWPEEARRASTVSGTVRIPVLMGEFANTGSPPITRQELQQELFDGPWPTGTLSDLYDEMSYGRLAMTGTVYDWVTVSEDDAYYEGGCYGLCQTAKTGQFILELLEANDPAIDFGQFDNDGPDGIPNSGDDDGYVDFIAFVHPEIGGECGNNSIWSHRWVVRGWPEFPSAWETNDARAGGGKIKIDDYTIQPALSCNGSLIEIGVYCHEFGHALGLPDLYDTDGGGMGIGHHGLMGSGNWNSPSNPAHMSAWSKYELGWVDPIVVEGAMDDFTIPNVEQNPVVYQLNVEEDKFCRKQTNKLGGQWALHCGIDDAAGANRNWGAGGGYGNGWNEAVRHDFTYDGNGSVTLRYDVAYDTEQGFDRCDLEIRTKTGTTRLYRYSGQGVKRGETINLTPYLSGAGDYQIIARFTSDYSWSDEDGNVDSGDPFVLDNISVVGGGVDYHADFEDHEDGWYRNFDENPHKEFFLVENRSRAGRFDQALHGEGLMIWHIEQNVINSRYANTSGSNTTSGLKPAGVMLCEADGEADLLMGRNRGDGGDVYPGTSGGTAFDNTTAPGSRSYNGTATRIVIDNIGSPDAQMSATMRAGRPAPAVASVEPADGDGGSSVEISALRGSDFTYGATFFLRQNGVDHGSADAEWDGGTQLTGRLDLAGVMAGEYDLVVRNADGQEAVLPGGFTVNVPVPVFIQAFNAVRAATGVALSWDLWADEPVAGFRLVRRAATTGPEDTITTGLLPPEVREFVDATAGDEAYTYALIVVLGDGSELRSGAAQVGPEGAPQARTSLAQNFPNPFNPTTRIGFALEAAARARLAVYDASGRRLAVLVDRDLAAGPHEVTWDATDDRGLRVASGVYFYRLTAGGQTLTRKLTVLK